MRAALAARLAEAGRARRRAGLQRLRRIPPPGLVDFCSNDYLGLARDPEVAAALGRSAAEQGSGARASALVSGYGRIHAELEARLADWLGFEACVLFVSGYQANLAVGQALLGRGDGMVADRLNHASLNDAARLAGARIRRYAHADPAAAEARADGAVVLVTDGVFSMDGDLAPLAELAAVADRSGTALWLDDAHGLGVLGANGRGLMEQAGVEPERVDVFTGTFGKSFGAGGAFVAGDRALVEALENDARGLIFSTALSPALAGAVLAALDRVRGESWRRERLHQNVARFRAGAKARGLTVLPSESAIQPLVLGENRRALEASAGLERRGYLVTAIRPPTVPAGSARLRITLSTAHESAQIDGLLDALAAVVEEAGE